MLNTKLSDVSNLSTTLLLETQNYIKTISTIKSSEELSKYIESNFTSFCKTYFSITDSTDNGLDNQDNNIELYQLLYIIPELFKDYAILHRDTNLQLQIANFVLSDYDDSDVKIKTHFKESIDTLLKASKTLETSIAAIQNKNKEKAKTSAYALQHYKNPWPIYKNQIEEVLQQLKQIRDNKFLMSKTISVFNDIKESSDLLLDQIVNNNSTLLKHINEAIKAVREIETLEDVNPIIKWVDQTLLTLSKAENNQEDYASKIDAKIKKLNTATIPVKTNNGLLVTKKIDFNKTVKKWFDFEIFPSIIDLTEQETTTSAYFKHSLLNLKSSLTVEKNNKTLNAIPTLVESLKSAHANLNENNTTTEKTVSKLKQLLSSHFTASKIYNDHPFLEVTLQSSISQLATDHNDFYHNIKNKIFNRFNKLNTKLGQTSLFSDQNKIEDTIQCINYRMFKEVNAHYDNLFFNKNFIGNLFLSPRQKQEANIEKSISQWKNDFGKAIIITGDQFSGKSTFVDYISQKYFEKSTILLKKDSTITFNGRKFKTSHNLNEALQNIKKGFVNTKPLIVIDDLELWDSTEFSLLDNVRVLIDFIYSESDNALVIVTTTNQLKKHLDNRLRFTEAFSNTIKLDKASFDEIYNAVMLRHSASHKILVSKNLEPLSPKQIKQFVLKLCKKLDYNLGEVLQAWTFGTTLTEDNKVIYEDNDPGFKDFLNKEELIILKQLIIFNKITEIQLKKFVGKSYEAQYKPSLKRLSNTKIILRENGGQLRLNPVITKDIKQLLIYRGILN